MGSLQRQVSSSSGSGSDCDPRYAVIDEKKRKRMESNRESARRSRMRKQKKLEDLVGQVGELQKANGQVMMQINEVSQNYAEVESANNVLRAQIMELTERLSSLNSVLYVVGEVSGVALDIPEIPDPLLKPWQLPCTVPPIIASADMFQF